MKKGLLGLVVLSLPYMQVMGVAPSTADNKVQNERFSSFKLKTFPVYEKSTQVVLKRAKLDVNTFNKTKSVARSYEGHDRVDQMYKGVPVYGAQVINHYKRGALVSQSGRVANIESLDVTPSFSREEAIAKVSNLNSSFGNLEAKLYVFPTANKNFLVWLVNEGIGGHSQYHVFMDAKSGEVLDMYNAINHGTGIGVDSAEKEFETTKTGSKYVLQTSGQKINTHDAANSAWTFFLPGDLVESKDDFFDDQAGVDAHFYAIKYIEFLKNQFDRDSFDGKGAAVTSSVHFGTNYVNAFWNGKQMVYGDGDGKMSVALSGGFDVIAHEVTHAITTHTSGLIYRNESGALNEAFSDILAAYAEHVVQPEKADYLVGEDIWTPDVEGDALRYMHNPTLAKNNTDHYDSKYSGSADNGGVHWNSGIANLAFYLLAEGGKHPRLESEAMEGIGIKLAGMVFWKTFTERLVSSSNFADCRNEMIAVAEESFDESVVSAVKSAWSLVGVE